MIEFLLVFYACGLGTLWIRAIIAIVDKRIQFSGSLLGFFVWPILIGFKDGRKFLLGIIVA